MLTGEQSAALNHVSQLRRVVVDDLEPLTVRLAAAVDRLNAVTELLEDVARRHRQDNTDANRHAGT